MNDLSNLPLSDWFSTKSLYIPDQCMFPISSWIFVISSFRRWRIQYFCSHSQRHMYLRAYAPLSATCNLFYPQWLVLSSSIPVLYMYNWLAHFRFPLWLVRFPAWPLLLQLIVILFTPTSDKVYRKRTSLKLIIMSLQTSFLTHPDTVGNSRLYIDLQ